MKKPVQSTFPQIQFWGWLSLTFVPSLILISLCLWWFTPQASIQADLGDDILWTSPDSKSTRSLAWGDADGDGDLDIAVGNNDDVGNELYLNNGQGNFIPYSLGLENKRTRSIVWGDADGDGDLDLAVGNVGDGSGDVNQIYINEGQGNFTPHDLNVDNRLTWSLAWGDADGDGDLDLAVGNNGQRNQLYLNNGQGQFISQTLGIDNKISWSVAWGDADADGDLDIAVGNRNDVNQLYFNDGGGNFIVQDLGTAISNTWSIAWGDADADGDLDMAVGNEGQRNQLYLNDGSGQFTVQNLSTDNQDTRSIAWGDVNGDGHLDIAVGNSNQVNQIYLNEGQGQFTLQDLGTDSKRTESIVWGDADGDGDLDMAVGNRNQVNQVHRNDGQGQFTGHDLDSEQTKQRTYSLAWGDADGDGDLDIAVGNRGQANQLYLNEGQGQFISQTLGLDGKQTYSLAWGDADGDGDLDIAVGNEGDVNQIYFNNGLGQFTEQDLGVAMSDTKSIAWGDADSDGDLDMAVGNREQRNQLYINDGAGQFTAQDLGIDSQWTHSLAWGDADGDGDLDVAVGNRDQVNQLYLNDGTGQFTAQTLGIDNKDTRSVAWGDADGDGDLDVAVGNWNQVNQLYLNEGQGNFTPQNLGIDSRLTYHIAWGDGDGDGDLDIAVGNSNQANQLYYNDGQGNFTPQDLGTDSRWTRSLAWGDADGDGDLDIAVGNGDNDASEGDVNQVYYNHRQGNDGLPNNAPYLTIARPDNSHNANFYASAIQLSNNIIPVSYTLFDAEADPIGQLAAFYSLDGGDHWQPAIPTTNTLTTHLTPQNHTYHWDTFASGFFGQSDNVVLRFVATSPTANSTPTQTYYYTNSTPSAYQRPYASATTFPFRVRGTQVQVVSQTISGPVPVQGAIVYRLPNGQTSEAALMPAADQLHQTNIQGYLPGHGTLALGDQLMALLPVANPISFTDKISLYHTSAPATATGLAMQPVVTSGVQLLTVTEQNHLMLLNLNVSLEWDGRHDPDYLEQLTVDIKQASEILFDLSNGQIALGHIRIFQAREQWQEADIVIYANNNVRPNSNLGGIVSTPYHDTFHDAQETISNAFIPGQIRIGATWNRNGNSNGTIGEDWPRMLAHEISQYAFFLFDNYVGLSPEDALVEVDCAGSVMTDAYRQDYSEFLDRYTTTGDGFAWTEDCLNTITQQTTGRSDWDTLTTFYPFLNHQLTNTLSGPSHLPLAVTNVSFKATTAPTNTLTTPLFHLTDANGSPLALSPGQVEGVVYKTTRY